MISGELGGLIDTMSDWWATKNFHKSTTKTYSSFLRTPSRQPFKWHHQSENITKFMAHVRASSQSHWMSRSFKTYKERLFKEPIQPWPKLIGEKLSNKNTRKRQKSTYFELCKMRHMSLILKRNCRKK